MKGNGKDLAFDYTSSQRMCLIVTDAFVSEPV